MSISKPFIRTYRPFVNGKYSYSGNGEYVSHGKYALMPEFYTRAFILLQKDLLELFDYIEPSDINAQCYSYRIHALLQRACIEVEANCKAILQENGYEKITKGGISNALDRSDYKKINITHHLSSYKIKVPYWNENNKIRTPFSGWANTNDGKLLWYDAYNDAKHNRAMNFQKATFDQLINAVCGVLVLLSAQFGTNSFSPGPSMLIIDEDNGGWENAIGDYFQVMFPTDWSNDNCYDFQWSQIKGLENPFEKIDFLSVKQENNPLPLIT